MAKRCEFEGRFSPRREKEKDVICTKRFTFADGKRIILMRYLIAILSGVVTSTSFAQNIDSEGIGGLKELRQQIDSLDNELMRTLANRMEVCVAVGKYKKEHKIAVVQTNRFSELVERLCKDGTAMGLSEDFIVKIMNLIHEESVRQQKQLMQEQKGKTVIVYYDVSVGTTAILCKVRTMDSRCSRQGSIEKKGVKSPLYSLNRSFIVSDC